MSAKGKAERLPSTGLPLGILADALHDEQVIRLQPGDRIVAYSDGISEARNRSGDLFGAERLREFFLGQTAGVSLEAVLRDALQTVLAWSLERGETSDDLSLLALEVQRSVEGN